MKFKAFDRNKIQFYDIVLFFIFIALLLTIDLACNKELALKVCIKNATPF